jgi:hypothetical protein
MNGRLAIIILGALVVMVNCADAQHRTGGQTNVRHQPRTSGQAYAHARRETPQYRSLGGLYESYSQGSQPYPNPDRELYVNRTCC